MTQSDRINRQWILAERPVGEPDDNTLRLVEAPIPAPDQNEMLLRAELSQEQLDDAVDCCVGCTRPNTCKKMLKSANAVMSLPEYCRNGDLFRTMAAK